MLVRDIQSALEQNRAELSAMRIRSLSIFGSIARNEARPDSDVDLLVEFEAPVGLFHFSRVRRRLSVLLGRPVDLVTPSALRDELRGTILKEAIYAA